MNMDMELFKEVASKCTGSLIDGCLNQLGQLHTTVAEQSERIEQLEAENEKLSRYKNHYEFAAATTEAVIAENEKLSLYKNLADEYGLVVFADLAELQKQRDELLAALKVLSVALKVGAPEYEYQDWCDIVDEAIASVKEHDHFNP